MPKPPTTNKRVLKELNTELKNLQAELAAVNKAAGIDDHITVKITTNQAHFERTKTRAGESRNHGVFYIQVDITTKSDTVFIPLSIASGKKPTGFLYQIEGTAAGAIGTATIKCRGEGITEITVGTIQFAKIPTGSTATFTIQITIEGKRAKIYNINLTKINYKLSLTVARYQSYTKELRSRSVTLS